MLDGSTYMYYHHVTKDCHDSTKPAFVTSRGVSVYGASRYDAKGLMFDYWIELTGSASPTIEVIGDFPLRSELLTCSGTPPTLVIDWDDGDAAPVTSNFWDILAKAINRLKKNSTVMVSCMGGHGRTGTALAILASKLQACPPKMSPIEFIRENYCKSAVESLEQVEYIEEILGMELKDEPARRFKTIYHHPDHYLGNKSSADKEEDDKKPDSSLHTLSDEEWEKYNW